MSGGAPSPDASSEDVCAIPEAMRGLVIPRRGRPASEQLAADPLTADPNAAAYLATWLGEHSAVIDGILDNRSSAVNIVKEYRASQGDLAAATPLGAAVGSALVISPDTPASADPAGVTDAWIAVRGHAFAAAAANELF